MFFSMARLTLTAAALLLPICVQAVAFTDDSFDGIAVGKPMNLTWSGDKTVRCTTFFHPSLQTNAIHTLSQSP